MTLPKEMREADDADKLHNLKLEYTKHLFKAWMWLILTQYKICEEVSL